MNVGTNMNVNWNFSEKSYAFQNVNVDWNVVTDMWNMSGNVVIEMNVNWNVSDKNYAD